MNSLVSRLSRVRLPILELICSRYTTSTESETCSPRIESRFSDDQHRDAGRCVLDLKVGDNVSRKDKIKHLLNTLRGLNDSKEAVYGALDAWVAWEQDFPISSLKLVLVNLEKEQQWHRVIQVIKWMSSKGQGNTLGTYSQLIRAFDMDHRAEEAHVFWERKIGVDLHSVPWQLIRQMIAVYYRNNMPEHIIKLFNGLEAIDRKPPESSIVQRVADAYEMLGMVEQKEGVLQKYNEIFTQTDKKGIHKSKNAK